MNLKELDFQFFTKVSVGADNALVDSGALPDTLTKAQAFRRYGRANVERWILDSLIHPVKMQGGSKKFIDRLKLEAVARRSSRNGNFWE